MIFFRESARIRVAPYLVFYRIGDDAIEIVRVLHDRRDLEAALAAEDPTE